jgi:hypothetical protein
MEKYQDVIIDPSGNALADVTVRVKIFGMNDLAKLYADNSGTPKVNPMKTDANGHFWFYTEQGRYSLELTGGGIISKTVTDIWVDDVIYALRESPVFTGNPTAPTPPVTDGSQRLATTQFTASLMSLHVASADPHPVYLTKAEMDARYGGTVTQLVDKTTAVELNKNTGEIITADTIVPSGASVAFTMNNLVIDEHDNIVINLKSGSAAVGVYNIWVDSIAKGSCNIVIRNISTSMFGEALKLQFTVIKGAIS